MKNTIRSLLVAITAMALLVSCSGNFRQRPDSLAGATKSSIVGKWQGIDSGVNLEFFKDGTFTSAAKDAEDDPLRGKYSFIEDGRIVMEFGGMIGELSGAIILSATISGDELSYPDPGSPGTLWKFRRAK